MNTSLNVLQALCLPFFKDMFGEDSVPKTFTGDKFEVVVDQKSAKIDLSSLRVACEEDMVTVVLVSSNLPKSQQHNSFEAASRCSQLTIIRPTHQLPADMPPFVTIVA